MKAWICNVYTQRLSKKYTKPSLCSNMQRYIFIWTLPVTSSVSAEYIDVT